MEIKEPRITFLVNSEFTEIELMDTTANITFAKVRLTPEQLSTCLSRQGYVKCEMNVFNLEKIGTKHENKSFVFEIPKDYKKTELNELCLTELSKQEMTEWKPDDYYSSQDSIFAKDGKQYAKATIRRWVK